MQIADSGSLNVSRTISPNDQMLPSPDRIEEYLAGGRMALDICLRALDGTVPQRILDFPSGHGRVLRWMRAQWPNAEIHAVEVDPDALAFCAESFGARAIQSRAALRDLALPGGVDLIWSGSLLTHFNEAMWDDFLICSLRALRPGGKLVFTAHGRIAAMLASRGHEVFGDLIDVKALARDYGVSGFSYRDYDVRHPIYGLTLSAPSWVMRKLESVAADAKVVSFTEGGWGYQDAYALEKLSWRIEA